MFLAVAPLALGCVSPVGVERVDPRVLHRALTSNAISTGELSEASKIVFEQHDLARLLVADPVRALAAMHEAVTRTESSDMLFALAEASFAYAEQLRDPVHARAAAIYAYAYLFPDDPADDPNPYDPRFRLACNLYNRGLTRGFATSDGERVAFQTAVYDLPFGRLEAEFDESQRAWGQRTLDQFVPVAELEVRGLRNRYRQPGVGAPLSAGVVGGEAGSDANDFVPPQVKVPVNVLLRIDRPRAQLLGDEIRGVFELRVGLTSETVEIAGRTVPLELEMSSSLAYMLDGDSIWAREFLGFFLGDLTLEETRLRALQPYVPGRTPVVLVHGTASSAERWANMLNDLGSDPRIRKNFQFWFFTYDTGNPVAYSAGLLRAALERATERFDPEGNDPAIREMVLIGHSQGGMLVKMAVIDSGDTLWNAFSRVPIAELDLEPETRKILEDSLLVEPLPFVRRVVFIATPQRGSFVAGSRIAHWITSLIRAPAFIARASIDLLSDNRDRLKVAGQRRIPSSVDNMTPGNPFVLALATIPVAPSVHAHSIIAVITDGPKEEGNDGVVEYRSAHIDEAESELVVHSKHSVQDHPDAIEEVRRILLMHRGAD